MTTTTHAPYTQAAQPILTTELNSVIHNNTTFTVSGVVDNTTSLDLFMDLELQLAAQGVARSAGGIVVVYAVYSLDGTNYADALDTTCELVATFSLDAATNARRVMVRDIPISPGRFKLFVKNQTGQTLAASGNVLSYRTHSVRSV